MTTVQSTPHTQFHVDTTARNTPTHGLRDSAITMPIEDPIKPVFIPNPSGAVGMHGLVRCTTDVSTVMFLRPMAAPSAMGMAGFFVSMWVLATYLCDWIGTDDYGPGAFFALVAVFGGLGQFIAGLQGYPARDNLATVLHCAWGSFFLAYGIQIIIQLTGIVTPLPRYGSSSELGMWLICLAAVTLVCLLVSFSRDIFTISMLIFLTAGSTITAAGYFGGYQDTIKAGGYFFILSSLCALLRTTHLLLEESFGRVPTWFPTFSTQMEVDKPRCHIPVDEPGVKKGQ